MSLITELSSDFSSAVRSRGADYFQQGRVKIKNGSDWGVFATVRESTTYDVDLSIEEDQLVVYCTCPDFNAQPCAHLWATILAVEEKGFLRGDGKLGPLEMVPESDDDYDDYDDYDDEGDEDENVETSKPSLLSNVINLLTKAPQSKDKPPSWKEQLAALGRTARTIVTGRGDEWSPVRRFVYVIDVPATLESQHLILDTPLQDRKQDGQWGKPRRQRIPRAQIADLPDSNDRQIFAMLAGSREQMEHSYYGYNYQDAYDTVPYRHRITSPLPQIILPLIGRTGHCFLKLESQSEELSEIKWDEGEPWRFDVRVRRQIKRSDQYEVEGVLRRGEEFLDFNKPVLILQGGLIFTRESAARLDDGEAFHWISILRRTGALIVPENQIGEFMNEVLSQPQPPRLDLPEELRYEEVTTNPQPCLTVKSQQRSPR
ncbi:MAG: SWIM zinc finger family protein, partial [Blastocatellia bacterium]